MLDRLKTKVTDSQMAHQITVAVESGYRVPGFVLLALLLAIPATAWGTKIKRDSWWRAELARSSSAVRGVIETGSKDIEATDEEIINALAQDAKELDAARTKLSTANVAVDGCAPVPARCLGVR